MSRAILRDWFWHRLYWMTFRLNQWSSDLSTNLAEKCIDARVRVWKERSNGNG